jgi:hypothetical protein
MGHNKKSTWGQSAWTAANRFLFPGDAPRSHGQINHDSWGDRRTRQYKEHVNQHTGEVTGGKTRDITGAELRHNRQRDANWINNSRR